MKKQIKYIAVVCGFFMIAGIFAPSTGNVARALEIGTVSGGNLEEGTITEEMTTEETTSEETIPEETTPEETTPKGTVLAGRTNKKMTINYVADGSKRSETIETVVSGDQFLITTPTTPEKVGYLLKWVCTDDTSGSTGILKKEYNGGDELYLLCSTYSGKEITLEAQWTESTSTGGTTLGVLGKGEYDLTAGETYTLGAGTWTVSKDGSSDNCTYSYSSDRTFSVGGNGTYTFSK